MRRRSHEPPFWVLFGAGGVIAAFTLPALVLVTGLLGPLGLLGGEALAYDRIRAFVARPLGALVLLAPIALPMWLAAHRIHHTVQDLRLPVSRKASAVLCYGLAVAGSALTALTLLRMVGAPAAP